MVADLKKEYQALTIEEAELAFDYGQQENFEKNKTIKLLFKTCSHTHFQLINKNKGRHSGSHGLVMTAFKVLSFQSTLQPKRPRRSSRKLAISPPEMLHSAFYSQLYAKVTNYK